MPVSSFQFSVFSLQFAVSRSHNLPHTRAWMTSDISPTSCWSVITCRGRVGQSETGGRGGGVTTYNNAQQCFALVRPIIPGRWMDERQACWKLTYFRLAYTLILCPCPCTSLPVVRLPSGNRHYANLFADNVSRKQHKKARRGGTSSSSKQRFMTCEGQGRKRVTVGRGRGTVHGENSW